MKKLKYTVKTGSIDGVPKGGVIEKTSDEAAKFVRRGMLELIEESKPVAKPEPKPVKDNGSN
jgi:hypothetical protein